MISMDRTLFVVFNVFFCLGMSLHVRRVSFLAPVVFGSLPTESSSIQDITSVLGPVSELGAFLQSSENTQGLKQFCNSLNTENRDRNQEIFDDISEQHLKTLSQADDGEMDESSETPVNRFQDAVKKVNDICFNAHFIDELKNRLSYDIMGHVSSFLPTDVTSAVASIPLWHGRTGLGVDASIDHIVRLPFPEMMIQYAKNFKPFQQRSFTELIVQRCTRTPQVEEKVIRGCISALRIKPEMIHDVIRISQGCMEPLASTSPGRLVQPWNILNTGVDVLQNPQSRYVAKSICFNKIPPYVLRSAQNHTPSTLMRILFHLEFPFRDDITLRVIHSHDWELLQLFIDNHIHLDFVSSRGENLLHAAVKKEELTEALEPLIQGGVNVNEKDSYGNTPLMSLLMKKYGGKISCKLFPLSLERGLDVSIQNHDGNTLLHYSLANYGDSAAYLLLAGASITVTNAAGQTPMEYGLEYYRKRRRGSSFEILTRFLLNDYPELMQIREGMRNIVLLLLNWRFIPPVDAVPFLQALFLSDMHQLLKLCIEKFSFDIDFVDERSGQTLLHLAARQVTFYSTITNTEYFLAHGASKYIVDNNGYYPIHYAAHSSPFILDQFQPSEDDVNMLTEDGLRNTPLHLAIQGDVPCTSCVEWLLQHGADKSIKNRRGETALDILKRIPFNPWTDILMQKLC